MNWLTQYIVGRELDKMLRENPEKVIKGLIKKYLKGYHLASNPVRKEKRTQCPAII